MRIGGSPSDAVPGRLLPRGDADLGRYRVRRSKHQQAFGRVGELADPVIIVRRVCGHSLYVAVEMAGQRGIP